MVENFKDNITYGSSTLAVSGDAVIIGSTNAGPKSVIFNNTGSQGHLAWQPTNNRTISLPDSGGVIQLTGQVPGAIGAGTQTQTSGTLIFSNSNGVTFGMSNSSVITASYTVPSTAGLISNINISAGTTSNNLSAVTFSNSNGLAFGLNGSTITGSYTVPTQTNQTVGLYALGNTTQNSSTTLDARTLSFNGLGIITAGYSNGSIQISATQSNQTEGRYALGNTTGQSSSSTFDARTMSISGAGNVSVGYSGNALVISGAGGAGGGIAAAAGTQTQTSGTVVFSNSNGITFGMSNSSVITASFNGTLGSVVFSNSNNIVFGSAGATTITASAFVNVSAGTTSNNLSAVTFSNSNGISFGLNASTITASYTVPTQTNQTVGLYALGNTTQNSSTTLDARTLSFNGLGIVTAGYSNGSIQISATQSNQTLGRYAIGNTTGQSSSSTFDARTMSISGAGIISVGYSGNALVISATGGGGGGNINVSAGTTSNNLTNFVLSNSNGISFGLNGSTVTASASAQTAGLYALGNTTQNSSTTLDIRTLSFNGLGGASVGYSNGSIQVSVPAGSNISATGILSASVNGNTLSLGVPNQTIGFYAVSNTTQNSSTTLDIRSVSIQGAGIASVGYSNGSVVVSVPSAGASINVSAGTTSNNVGAITFSNANGVSFGLNGSVITASAAGGGGGGTASLFALGNTTQNSSTSLDIRSLSYNGLGAMTVGYSNGSIQLSAPAASSLSATGLVSISTNGSTISIGVPGPNFSAGTTSSNLSAIVFSNSNGMFFGLNGSTITASAPINISAGTTSNNMTNWVYSNSNNVSFGLNGSTITASIPVATLSHFGNVVVNCQTYATQQMGNSVLYFWPMELQTNFSFSNCNIYLSNSVTVVNSTAALTLSFNIGIYSRNANTMSLVSSGSTSTQLTNSSTNNTSIIQGIKNFVVPINASLTPGNYYVGIISRTASANTNVIGLTNLVFGTGQNNISGVLGQAVNATNQIVLGLGVHGTTFTSMPASVAFSQLNGTAGTQQVVPMFDFRNF